jgi:hypothetical protein
MILVSIFQRKTSTTTPSSTVSSIFTSWAHFTPNSLSNNELFIADSQNHRICVISADKGELLRQWGSKGEGPNQFLLPFACIVYRNAVFVADCWNSRVQVFDTSGSFVASFGGYGSAPGLLGFPMGLCIDQDELFVAENGTHRISVFDVRGKFLRWIGGHGLPSTVDTDPNDEKKKTLPSFSDLDQKNITNREDVKLDVPYAMCVLQHRLFVVDTDNHRICVFDKMTGQFLFAFAGRGQDDGQLSHPRSISVCTCLSHEPRLFVCDGDNHRICIFSASSGQYLGKIGQGQLFHPRSCFVNNCVSSSSGSPSSKSHNLFVSDSKGRILIFDHKKLLTRLDCKDLDLQGPRFT